MCGRFTMHTPAAAVLGHFHIASSAVQLPLRFNIAPTQLTPVVRLQGGERCFAPMRWGLVPFWSKDPKAGARLINARSETAASKPSFRAAFKRRRCLVPSDGYFEWEKRGKQKLPHYIQMDDGRLFAYAGLWETWGQRDEEDYLETFTILTTSANGLTSSVHDRMPAILDDSNYDLWLDPEFDNPEPLQAMLRPYDSDAMKMRRVSTRVNNVRHDDPECLASEQELF